MNYYEGFRERLLSDAKRSKRDVLALVEESSLSEEDMVMFYELLMINRKSEYVFTEHIRAKHMLLKSCLEPGQ